MKALRLIAIVAALALGGCVTYPTGPSLGALPGTGKNFDEFRSDDVSCRQYANDSIGGRTPERAQSDSAALSAIAGAAIGAAIGGAAGGGHGAAIGAGVGLGAGGLAGAGAAQVSGAEAQRRYDAAYGQCMYARGHKIPVASRPRYYSPYYYPAPVYAAPPPAYVPPPAPPAGIAPPPAPPGSAPPPPPPGSAPRA